MLSRLWHLVLAVALGMALAGAFLNKSAASREAEFELEEHHLKLLTAACESWDRCQQARRRLKKHGLTYADRFGQPRARPEVGIERDNRIAFAR